MERTDRLDEGPSPANARFLSSQRRRVAVTEYASFIIKHGTIFGLNFVMTALARQPGARTATRTMEVQAAGRLAPVREPVKEGVTRIWPCRAAAIAARANRPWAPTWEWPMPAPMTSTPRWTGWPASRTTSRRSWPAATWRLSRTRRGWRCSTCRPGFGVPESLASRG